MYMSMMNLIWTCGINADLIKVALHANKTCVINQWSKRGKVRKNGTRNASNRLDY